ncbi:MAG: ribonuclease III [Acidimicrobiales bacterium]
MLNDRPPAVGLSKRLGREFNDSELLERAMAHRSWCAENPGNASNERLEFLGDAVLGLVVTAHVYRLYPLLPEGQLAQVRASVVNSAALAETAEGLGIGDYLLLGKGEDASSGREKPTILADAMEAVIGAVYLDGGWEAAEELVLTVLGERIREAAAGPGASDYKTRLQELASRQFDQLPKYEVEGTGPDHAKHFTARVILDGRELGTGQGRSKKQAEQAAARVAWHTLAAEAAVVVGDLPAGGAADNPGTAGDDSVGEVTAGGVAGDPGDAGEGDPPGDAGA